MDAALFPMPRAGYAQRDAALRGRYIANTLSGCVSCHTPRENGKLALDKAYQGGMSFDRHLLAAAPSSYPEKIYSSNITPHATGIADYSVRDVVRALKHGVDRQQRGICEPMPVGPKDAFGGLTDGDAEDIAHYLKAIPARDNTVPNDCVAQLPSDRSHAAR